jgi:ABC-type transporter Mla subunit MlaD
MALQDLTPQLRTRMTRVERLVGLFVLLAAVLLGFALAYYIFQTGKRRGWFIKKIPYYCYTRDAIGLKTGDPVRLLGRDVGRIVEIETTQPDPWFVLNNYNVFVKFEIWDPYFGYIWTDSKAKVEAADFFGSRYLEVTRGESDLAYATVIPNEENFKHSLLINDKDPFNGDPTNRIRLADVKEGVWLQTIETPALSERIEDVVLTVASALPALTNQVSMVLAQSVELTSNANLAVLALEPSLTNVQGLVSRLRSEEGAIGRMLLTTNLQADVHNVLAGMNVTLTNTTELIRTSEQQLRDLTHRLALTLDNVALVTSNLSAQVSANSVMLDEISSLVVNADDLLQGLKRHWLLRSAFDGAASPPQFESVIRPTVDLPPHRREPRRQR